ncbi:AEC family transporter [Rhodobacterales bacterium HKCCE4037]|nr:AEC family transporter [Rhodobacterales bacterium HKCCE4037]
MLDLLAIVLPVFLVVGAGYAAVWRGLFKDSAVDGLMIFTQKFAIPCLLFSAIATIDLDVVFDLRILISFYTGSTLCFFAGMFGARLIFGRPWTDSVAIGFSALFANTVLLGLPISERAYGADALGPNFTIIAFHAPFCYLLGITTMEIVRAETRGPKLAGTVAKAMFQNALMIGIMLGFAVNFSGVPIPGVLREALDLMIRAALPAALFGLGGVLYRYKPEGDVGVVIMVCVLSLILHPAVAFGLGTGFGLSQMQLQSAVVTAAMAPGVNTYIFADMYGCARRVAATSLLVGTALTVLTAAAWIAVLG